MKILPLILLTTVIATSQLGAKATTSPTLTKKESIQLEKIRAKAQRYGYDIIRENSLRELESLKERGQKLATETSAKQPKVTQSPEQKQDSLDRLRKLNFTYTPSQMDSILSELTSRRSLEEFNSIFLDEEEETSPSDKPISDSVYIERLNNLVSPIQLPYNSIVRNYISRYTNTKYGTINRILSLSQYYFPAIEQELIKQGLPVELRAMAIIESALSAKAVSRAGAAGLWQFMPATGKLYGLEVNSLVDERCDPEKSTIAACRFMKDLYNMYNDWSLAIAAYNCGPGNVNKALARSKVDRENGTFWDVYYYLPRETRGYVPAFIGATYAYAYHKQHNITFSAPPLPISTDTIKIDRIMHLEQVASTIDISIDVLRALNPQYRKDIIPATTKTYSLRLPQSYISKYIEHEQEIFAKDSACLKEFISPEKIEKARKGPSFSVHVVRSGETLGAIARKYRVSVKQLMAWNNIKSAHKIRVGQRLKVGNR
ncbi:MAG: transglycosylase SLT domain-containing protein [Rikenellaceae bacterium]